MTKNQKIDLLRSVKATVKNKMTPDGEVKLQEIFFVQGGWGKSKKVVPFDDMIQKPVETLKRFPQLRKKFQVSDEAYQFILDTPLSDLLNLLNTKKNAKETNS